MAPDTITPFDWHRILWSDDAPPAFLWEVALRCVVTYLLVVAALRVTGRRGVRQLSLFELSIILALGSAGGDTMFYADVPLTHVAVVFVVVPLLYLGFNILTERSTQFSDWLEGRTVCIMTDGEMDISVFKRQRLTQKELFGELRQRQVEHLGQVRKLYLEADGNISPFFYPEDEPVRPGLPIFPELFATAFQHIRQAGAYSCITCGHTATLAPTPRHCCPRCQHDCWLPACTTGRVG